MPTIQHSKIWLKWKASLLSIPVLYSLMISPPKRGNYGYSFLSIIPEVFYVLKEFSTSIYQLGWIEQKGHYSSWTTEELLFLINEKSAGRHSRVGSILMISSMSYYFPPFCLVTLNVRFFLSCSLSHGHKLIVPPSLSHLYFTNQEVGRKRGRCIKNRKIFRSLQLLSVYIPMVTVMSLATWRESGRWIFYLCPLSLSKKKCLTKERKQIIIYY